MKLLIVTPYFPPHIGGMENYAYNIAKGLRKQFGYEIVVVTSNHEKKEYKEEILEGMKIYRLPIQFKVSNTPISFRWGKDIERIIRKEKPDVINAHSPVPFIADVSCRVVGEMGNGKIGSRILRITRIGEGKLRKKKIPFILTYHCGSMIKEKGLIKNLIIGFYEKIILKKTIDNSDKVICSSDFVKNDFLKDYLGKTKTITPGVDINLFKPSLKQTKGNNVLFVGSLNKSDEYKSLDILIKSLQKVKEEFKDVKLIIVGEGDNKNNYLNLAEKYGLKQNVIFLGELYGKDLVREYQNTNVLVLPSVKESFGMVLIEAMACKKVVIGSRVEGIPHVIDDRKNGLLVPPKNSDVLANAIIKLLKNSKLAKEMGENGYKKVRENFTWDVKVKDTEKVIKGFLKK
ncbi:glycosyltransferase family 4 protein [Candidatus Pacearchaeota archaeon]|nr:glycosyltransferase family 4 protein [Candidatus Pacearchaeota archaeon]